MYEADPSFQTSCLNRFIYVKGIKNLQDALQECRECSWKSLDRRAGGAGTTQPTGDEAGALGRGPGLPPRPNAGPASGLATRWPARPRGFSDLDRL